MENEIRRKNKFRHEGFFLIFCTAHCLCGKRERERDYRVRADYGGSVWNRLINGFSDPKKKFLFTFAPKKKQKTNIKKERFLSNY